jgi:NitT/TauT family transport system permease protein
MSDVAISSTVTRKRAASGRSKTLGTTGIVVAIVVAIVAGWQLAVTLGWVNGRLFGSPEGIYRAAVLGLSPQGTLVPETLATLF